MTEVRRQDRIVAVWTGEDYYASLTERGDSNLVFTLLDLINLQFGTWSEDVCGDIFERLDD